jgi:hypothetical protein
MLLDHVSRYLAVTWLAINVGFQLYYRGLTDGHTIRGFKGTRMDGYMPYFTNSDKKDNFLIGLMISMKN